MANRNRIEMSEAIFLQLFERALSLDETFPVDLHPRWIKRLSKHDAELMARADVTPIKLSMVNSAAVIQHDHVMYFGASGFDEPSVLPPGLTTADTTPGLFGSFVFSLNLDAKATAAEIRDVIVGFNGQEPDYGGHDLSDVEALFPAVRFYLVDASYVYATSIERILGSYLARGYLGGPLRLRSASRELFASFFEDGPDTVPYALPLQGLLSFSWAGLYLELYRCIEQLYAVPRILRLTETWKTEESIFGVSKLLEDVLSWRPREDESLEFLFRDLDVTLCHALVKAIQLPGDQNTMRNTSLAAAKSVYALRNACVHYRPATQLANITDARWNDITVHMLSAVESLYSRHGERFHRKVSSSDAKIS